MQGRYTFALDADAVGTVVVALAWPHLTTSVGAAHALFAIAILPAFRGGADAGHADLFVGAFVIGLAGWAVAIIVDAAACGHIATVHRAITLIIALVVTLARCRFWRLYWRICLGVSELGLGVTATSYHDGGRSRA